MSNMSKIKLKEKLDNRRKNILANVVKEYIKTARPVSSEYLLMRYNLGVSPATIRNDMMFLEDEGYLLRPHMSSGRVPTDLGYRFYVDRLISEPFLNRSWGKIAEDLEKRMKTIGEDLNGLKSVADYLANASGNMGVVSFVEEDLVYQNGLSNLLEQPEFASAYNMKGFIRILDHLDEVISDLFKDDSETQICIGGENKITFPDFGLVCVSISCKRNKNKKFFAGIFGPKRMDYGRNIALISKMKELLN